MRQSTICAVSLICLLWAGQVKADQWLPYTDGRAGGCFVNQSGVLYGCTPQVNSGAGRSTGAMNCDTARRILENARNDFNRTVTSVRRAEAAYARSGCADASAQRQPLNQQAQPHSYVDQAAIAASKRQEEAARRELEESRKALARQIQMEQDARTAERNRNGPHCDSAEYQESLRKLNLKRLPNELFCLDRDETGVGPTYMNCPPCHREGSAQAQEFSEGDSKPLPVDYYERVKTLRELIRIRSLLVVSAFRIQAMSVSSKLAANEVSAELESASTWWVFGTPKRFYVHLTNLSLDQITAMEFTITPGSCAEPQGTSLPVVLRFEEAIEPMSERVVVFDTPSEANPDLEVQCGVVTRAWH